MDSEYLLQRQKMGPWNLVERKAKRTLKGDREVEAYTGSFILRAFIRKSQGRISIDYSSAFQLCPLISSGSWPPLIGWHHGRESLLIVAGLDISYGIVPPGLAGFLGLELKHNLDLDVISSLTKTLSLSPNLRLSS